MEPGLLLAQSLVPGVWILGDDAQAIAESEARLLVEMADSLGEITLTRVGV